MMQPDEMKLLAGAEFNRILSADPVLKELEAAKYDEGAEFLALLAVLQISGIGIRIGNLPIQEMLTPAKWALLDIFKSPFLRGGTVSTADADLFLYILAQPDLRCMALALHEIPGAASGYSAATGLSFESVCAEIKSVIHVAFLPFGMLPPCEPAEGSSHFDAMWLTNLCGIAARESNERVSHVYWHMSLTEVCCHYVNYRRRECADGDKIRRRPDSETTARIEARVDELAKEFLREKSDLPDGLDESDKKH